VFCGFLAENFREHYVEHKREKEYAKSLYDDLKSDTFFIQKTYNEKIWALEKMDSLQRILATSDGISNNNELIYYLERYLTRHSIFSPRDATYHQLLSSGSFRYFKSLPLYKKIAIYYITYDRYTLLGESEFEKVSDLTEAESKLFNGEELSSLNNLNAGTFYDIFKRPDRKFHPINPDEQSLNFLRIKIGNAQYSLNVSKYFLERLKATASEAIADLKKEYHLK